jgi:hypothetical protein
MVVAFLSMVIYKLVMRFAFINTAGLFQNLQGTVDCGLMHSGHFLLDVRNNLFRSDMRFSVMDDIHDYPALGCKF